jgi:hypothetical protein
MRCIQSAWGGGVMVIEPLMHFSKASWPELVPFDHSFKSVAGCEVAHTCIREVEGSSEWVGWGGSHRRRAFEKLDF